MQQLFPLQLSLSFKAKIISSEFITKINHLVVYLVHTNFGIMTLLYEELTKDCQRLSSQHDLTVNKEKYQSPQSKLVKRKQFLMSFPFCTFIPVIYEQIIIPSHKDRAVCLTLIQPIQVLKYNHFHCKINIESQKNLMLALHHISKTQQWRIKSKNCQNLKQLILFKSLLSGQLFIDFTQLQFSNNSSLSNVKENLVIENLLKQVSILAFSQENNQSKIQKVILIKDCLYKISKEKMNQQQFMTWHELCIKLNFLMEDEVIIKIVQTDSKGQPLQRTKTVTLKTLSSSQVDETVQLFNCKNKQSLGNFHFYDGFCTDLLEIVTYQQLLQDFFKDNSTYCLKKDTYLWIQRVQNNYHKKLNAKPKTNKCDVIIIEEGVQKWQCINFFITYCKFVEPTLKRINFLKQQNCLHFEFLGKWKAQRQLFLVFEPNYVIKDEELSMIIEKSKIQDLTLQLSGMQITDSFLMFLANSQKMGKIKHLDISYCLKATQNGVNSLLISPFCKSLQSINVSGTPIVQSSIESLLKKGQLKKLIMNNCPVEDSSDSNYFVIKNSKLVRLQAAGMNVTGSFGSSLKILKIGTLLPLQFLKELKDMPLKQLSIRLVEQKKNIIGGLMGTIGTFYSNKQSHPIKSFTQGTIASKNIKFLDLSQSQTKLKSLKHFFMMPQLQILRLQDILNTQQIDFSISPKIIDVSFKNTQISIRDLNQLLKNSKLLLKLNVSNTLIQKSQIVEFFNVSKKYINTLIISQNQYSMNLIDPNSKISEFVETYEIDCKNDFFTLKNQKLLSNMIYKTFRSNKNLKFKTNSQSESVSNLSNYINWYNIDSARNIFINDQPYKLVYERMKLLQQRQKKINCGQFLRVHLKNKRPLTIPFYNNVQGLQYHLNQELQVRSQLTNFLYLYRKTVLLYPQGGIQVSLKGNKVINCHDVIQILKSYTQHHNIKSIDFRQCTLMKNDILSKIVEIPLLETYNHNQYQVYLDEKNFVEISQKYLKFFMRISSIKKLYLNCKNIFQAQIFFSIFFHVFDYHYESIEELHLKIQGVKMTKENSKNFWIKLCELKRLKSLKIQLKNCQTGFLKKIFQECQLNQSRHLETLEIEGIDFTTLNSFQNGYSVINLGMKFQSSSITETNLIKLLKPFGPSLISLKLNLNQCDLITFPNKIFTILGEFKSLKSLSLSFEQQKFITIRFSCPLKQLSTIDFLENLYSLKKLQQLQLNFSFTGVGYQSIANVLTQLPLKLSKCHFVIFLVGNQKKQVQVDKEIFQTQGLQLIL